MQSYIDVSMTLIFMGAALLLLLVLISFLLLSRRASQQDRRLDSLQNLVDELSAQNKKLHEDFSLQDKRMQALELSYNAFNENLQKNRVQELAQRQEQEQQYLQKFTDLSQEQDSKIKSLQAKVERLEEQQQELLQRTAPVSKPAVIENTQAVVSPVVNNPTLVNTNSAVSMPSSNIANESNREDEARMLIKSGMGLNEVASRTGLSAVEIDMIANMLSPSPDESESLPPPVVAVHAHEAKEELTEHSTVAQKTSLADEEFVKKHSPLNNASTTHHVASLKARNAYGMSLRHQR